MLGSSMPEPVLRAVNVTLGVAEMRVMSRWSFATSKGSLCDLVALTRVASNGVYSIGYGPRGELGAAGVVNSSAWVGVSGMVFNGSMTFGPLYGGNKFGAVGRNGQLYVWGDNQNGSLVVSNASVFGQALLPSAMSVLSAGEVAGMFGASSGDDGLIVVRMMIPCGSGMYSWNGFAPCSVCPVGTYQPMGMSTSCWNCTGGKVSPAGSSFEGQCRCELI
jgi:hypothetical protein